MQVRITGPIHIEKSANVLTLLSPAPSVSQLTLTRKSNHSRQESIPYSRVTVHGFAVHSKCVILVPAVKTIASVAKQLNELPGFVRAREASKHLAVPPCNYRSEERRVGKECM